MQKSSNNNNVGNVFVLPRDHFLDNAGMSESDSDLDSIEEGMLIEAPVTPEKSSPAPGLDSGGDLVERQPVAGQEGDKGSVERQQTVDQQGQRGSFDRTDTVMADGSTGIAAQAGKDVTADTQEALKDKEVGALPVLITPQVPPKSHACSDSCKQHAHASHNQVSA